MMRVLVIKISSMGDVIHALPALTDAMQAIPNITFDWVVDRAFAEVPSWHPAVNHVIKSAHRIWRQNKWQSLQEVRQFYKQLRGVSYDKIIDAQSSIKSAVVTRLAKGKRFGMDRHTVREYGAHWFYHENFAVPRRQHAIERMRQLFAASFNYQYTASQPQFLIDVKNFSLPDVSLPPEYSLFIPNASWHSKCWPEVYWQSLVKLALAQGQRIVMPWGSEAERQRVQRIAAVSSDIIILPRLNLSALAVIISRAKAVVSVDTGLGHLAAALDIPAVTFYGPTDPFLIGATGRHQIHLTTNFSCAPCYLKQCNYKGPCVQEPACFEQLTPELAWRQLLSLL